MMGLNRLSWYIVIWNVRSFDNRLSLSVEGQQ